MNHEGHKGHEGLTVDVERLSRAVIDAGLKVHKALGPGLLESAYEHCLAHEVLSRGISLQRQVPLPIIYDGAKLDAGYRLDILVGSSMSWRSKRSMRLRASVRRKS